MASLLDLFCCQGGAARGYELAGFDRIVGVDIDPQPLYPYEFVQADALAFLAARGHEFDAIHASPPCQDHSSLNRALKMDRGTANLLPQTLAALRLGFDEVPWVVENVQGAAPLMPGATMLCGTAFGMTQWRHRLFLSNVLLLSPGCFHAGSRPRWEVQARTGRPSVDPSRRSAHPGGGRSVGAQGGRGTFLGIGYYRDLWGVPWMNEHGVREAIPPAYTTMVGEALFGEVLSRRYTA